MRDRDNQAVRLLVVEDERKLAQLLRRGLAEEGHAVDVAETGEEEPHRIATLAIKELRAA